MSSVDTKREASPSRRLWSVKETADSLGVSCRTIWRMIALGELKSVRIGRCVRILPASADTLIERGGSR
jgi:excisionase family DNA binding protein